MATSQANKRCESPVTVANRDGRRTPVVAGREDLTVAELVYGCHEKTIDRALDAFGLENLERSVLDQILVYCAEQRCARDDATCPGCNRRAQNDGILSLEDFVAHHETITIGDGRFTLTGQGTKTLTIDSLARLEKHWSGETYWYWARRILRKLRHGVRRSDVEVARFSEPDRAPVILLKSPQLADNIGMVARAMGNFGLDDLRLITPRDGWPNDKARIAASGANYIIDHTESYDRSEPAVADLNWLVATTARQRDLRKPVMTPAQAIGEMRRRIADGQRCGILFGGESSGLDNSDIALADAVVMIPVNPAFASLNLAQAVLLIGYEWLKDQDGASLGRVTALERQSQPGLQLGHDRPATKQQMVAFFEHLEEELGTRDFFKPVAKRPKLVARLRTLFTRAAPTDHEIRTLRGIVATLVKREKKGPSGDR